MIDRICDEKCRQYVDRIMKMSQKDDCPEKDRRDNKKYPKIDIVPKHKGEQKRKTGVPGEKKVSSEHEFIYKH